MHQSWGILLIKVAYCWDGCAGYLNGLLVHDLSIVDCKSPSKNETAIFMYVHELLAGVV